MIRHLKQLDDFTNKFHAFCTNLTKVFNATDSQII